MKKILISLLIVLLMAGCGTAAPATPVEKTASYKGEPMEDGSYITVDLTMTDDKISKIDIDEYYAKKQAFKDDLKDDYGIKSDKGDWYKQVEGLEKYLVGKTLDDVKAMTFDEKGHSTDADVLTVCTIGTSEIITAVIAAIGEAK